MKTSGSHIRQNTEESQAGNSLPMAPKNRLEDLLNDLMSLDASSPAANESSRNTPREQSGRDSIQKMVPPRCMNSEQAQKSLPAELCRALSLPGNLEGIYHCLKVFNQNNRYRPLLELPGGKVVYIEFDPEMERIRAFLGNKKHLTIRPRSAAVSSGYMIIETVFEYKMESSKKDFFGFSRTEQQVLEKQKKGRELLTEREAADQTLQPVLYFILFNDKSSGIAQCQVKAEHLND